MSYYRAIREDELTKWLFDMAKKHDLVFDNQLDAEALAHLLVEKYDVLGHSSTPV